MVEGNGSMAVADTSCGERRRRRARGEGATVKHARTRTEEGTTTLSDDGVARGREEARRRYRGVRRCTAWDVVGGGDRITRRSARALERPSSSAALGDAVVREAKREIYAREVPTTSGKWRGGHGRREGGGVAVAQRRAVLAVEEREQLVERQRQEWEHDAPRGTGRPPGGIHRRGHRNSTPKGKKAAACATPRSSRRARGVATVKAGGRFRGKFQELHSWLRGGSRARVRNRHKSEGRSGRTSAEHAREDHEPDRHGERRHRPPPRRGDDRLACSGEMFMAEKDDARLFDVIPRVADLRRERVRAPRPPARRCVAAIHTEDKADQETRLSLIVSVRPSPHLPRRLRRDRELFLALARLHCRKREALSATSSAGSREGKYVAACADVNAALANRRRDRRRFARVVACAAAPAASLT